MSKMAIRRALIGCEIRISSHLVATPLRAQFQRMAGSRMKDYVRRQLRYWVDDFRDDMLPRDFMTKSFTKTQLMLPHVNLKPHRVAAVLHLPPPLLVATVHCIELTIAVPAWSDTDKEAAHRPLLIHVNELLVQVRNVWECSSKIRRAAEERGQAALLEPDPLGSTAATFAFARDVNDRTKLVVDKLQVHIFVGDVSRVEMVLMDLNARTTDALGQDVRNSATCVDYSPDNLVQTRFKTMSFILSVVVNPAGSDVARKAGTQAIRLMSRVSVAVRITRFYHRKALEDSWKRHMQLVDVNFGAVKIELGIADFLEVYTVASTLCNWFWTSISSANCALFAPIDGMAADREPLGPGASETDQGDIELQITYRGTIEAKLKFTSANEGPQEFVFLADRAAGNVIFHRHGVRELQMSLHELAVRFRGYVAFRLKPDREVFHVVQRHNSLSVKWRVQSVLCRIDDDLAVMLKEMYHFVSEKEQVIVIRCGTCHQQISLDMIDVHVCPPRNGSKSVPGTPHAGHLGSRRSSFSEASSAESSGLDAEETSRKRLRVNGPAKVHAELHLDELELQTGSMLVRVLIKFLGIREVAEVAGRDVTTKLSNLRLTTESNEFAGDAIFVPALPLAFQMLECSLQGCRCYLRRQDALNSQVVDDGFNQDYRWPARLFLDIAQCVLSAQDCFVELNRVQMRSSFSDGSRLCSSSQPQLSFHVSMATLRCQLDRAFYSLAQQVLEHVGGLTSSTTVSMLKTLFLGVLQIRAVEFTMQDSSAAVAHAKSLLKQAIVVFDNQMGFLCTQSSVDLKTILNSSTMKFMYRQTPAIRLNTDPLMSTSDAEPVTADDCNLETCTQDTAVDPTKSVVQPVMGGDADEFLADKKEIAPSETTSASAPEEATCQDESMVVANALVVPPDLEREDASRCIQRMVRRKQLVRQKKQRFEADDYEPGVVRPIEIPAKIAMTEPDTGRSRSPTLLPHTLSLGIPSPIMIFGADNDFVGEIRGGINKLMSPLSRTRLHSDSIRGGINKLMGPINRSLSPTSKRRPSVGSVAPMVQVACDNVTTSEAITSDPDSPPPQEQCHVELKRPDDRHNARSVDEENSAPAESASVDASPIDDSAATKLNGLSEAKLAALPEVVRVLIQVGECRLCVPINPREKIEYLCREVVRRFNETFAADRGSISAVSLQDKHGGVFSPSDTVGFMLSIAPTELLFAHPHNHDGQIRSLARLAAGSSRTARSRPLRDLDGSSGGPIDGSEKRKLCSKLPLPLALALLANESERDLIRSGLCERDSGTTEAWPDLALNAASLDAEKNLLIVEVAWHDTCIEVTNSDAFALCRQILGLCTSRVTSKFVGKITRGRLKVDPSNPLVEWACRRGKVTEALARGEISVQTTDQEVVSASYEELKKAVQDTFGVYTR